MAKNAKSFIQECEDKILLRAQELTEMKDALDVFVKALYTITDRHEERYIKKIQEAYSLILETICHAEAKAINNAFLFIGVGDRIKEMSRKRAKELFGNDQKMIMHFLDRWGHCPGMIKTEEEDEFRKEVNEKLKN